MEETWDQDYTGSANLENIAQYAQSLQALKEQGKAEQVYRDAIQKQPDNYLAYAMFGRFSFVDS